jgi:hypothetical protein
VTERLLSHAIAEGDGISLVATVADAEAARAAEAEGAEALLAVGDVALVREATSLPILCYWSSAGPDGMRHADACVVRPTDLEQAEVGEDVEVALLIDDQEQLEDVLEAFDPELLLLEGTFENVLDLLADVPAGKLVIAEVRGTTGAEFEELERAGVDAVIVRDRKLL